eukprot:c15477_g1_i1.p1 GENE.c15477_g1_i1~~c15477_g1_i1.p1  ORF type:complete len:273 (+),score=72.02 c15477_g1_i1:110-820(+)
MIRDPRLTSKGFDQAAHIAGVIANAGIELVVSSPLTRTLQTTQQLLGESPPKHIKILVHEGLQEIATVPVDTGRPLSEIKSEFGDYLDFSEVEEFELQHPGQPWFGKESLWDSDTKTPIDAGQQALRERLTRLTNWLLARPEQTILLVGHHGIFCHLLNVELNNCEIVTVSLDENGSWIVPDHIGENEVIKVFLAGGKPHSQKGSAQVRSTTATIAILRGSEALAESLARHNSQQK